MSDRTGLRVLLVEDREDDALLLLEEFRRSDWDPICERAQTADELERFLQDGQWDVVIADYTLPGFSCEEALEICRRGDPDRPFIVVSGTIGEERAVEMQRRGAHDFILKERLARLIPAVEREVAEAAIRREEKRGRKFLQVLASAASAANNAVSLEAAIQEVLKDICLLLDWSVGHVYHIRQMQCGEKTLEPSGIWYAEDLERFSEFCSATSRTTFRPSEGLIGRVLSEKTLVWIEDVLEAPDYLRVDPSFGVRGAVGIPIRVKDRVVSVLEVYRDKPAPRDPKMAEILSQAGTHLGRLAERDEAESALRSREERLQAILDNSSALIYVKDLKGRLIQVNRKMREMLDEDPLGKSSSEFLPQELAKIHDGHDREVARKGRAIQFEERGQFPDGIHDFISVKFPLYGPGGEIDAVCGMSTDITELKRAHERNKLLAMAVAQAADGICVVTPQGEIVYCNDSMEKILGVSKEEVEERRHEGIVESLREVLDEAIASAEVLDKTIRGDRRDGQYIEMRTAVFPIRDEAGEILTYVVMGRDITQERLLEARLRQAEKLNALGTLAGGIAHDFNNFLGGIIGFTELVCDDLEEGSDAKEDLKSALDAAFRARDLVKGILTFSRQESSKGRIEVGRVVRDSLALLRAGLSERCIVEESLPREPLVVAADRTDIERILMNLATNAHHAIRESGSRLFVTVGRHEPSSDSATRNQLSGEEWCRLVVEDDGSGMDGQTMARAMEPFFTTKKRGEGTGLGLFTVHNLVKSLGGLTDIKSEKGRGTRVSVYLPLADEEEPAPETVEIAGEGEHILVVEDEVTLGTLLERYAKRLGYQVSAVETPKKALELFSEDPERYDLLVTDQDMPMLSGEELARKVREIRPGFPIVLTTGFIGFLSSTRPEELGVSEILEKPIRQDSLAKAIRQALGKSA